VANPLFAPPPKEAPKDYPWVDPTAKAFTLTVPAGWSIEGGLRVFERGLKYVVFTLKGPGGACVFWGDDRLPMRAVVPGPWNGPLMPPGPYQFVPPLKMMPWHCPAASAPHPFPERNLDPMRNAFETISLDEDGKVQRKRIPAEPDPIQPIWFGAGETAQRLYLGYYTPAAQLVHPVLFPRVGAILSEKVVDDTKLIDELRRAASQAGVHNKRLDAIIVDFISLDRRRKGRIHLATLGGDQQGETWECNFIRGFWSSPDGFAATEAAFNKVSETFSTDPKWIAANNDIMAARATTLKTEFDTAKWQESEMKKAADERALIDQIKKGAVDSIKSRKHGG
jgi:hypothetical protein